MKADVLIMKHQFKNLLMSLLYYFFYEMMTFETRFLFGKLFILYKIFLFFLSVNFT